MLGSFRDITTVVFEGMNEEEEEDDWEEGGGEGWKALAELEPSYTTVVTVLILPNFTSHFSPRPTTLSLERGR